MANWEKEQREWLASEYKEIAESYEAELETFDDDIFSKWADAKPLRKEAMRRHYERKLNEANEFLAIV